MRKKLGKKFGVVFSFAVVVTDPRMGFCPFSFDSLVSLVRLRVDSSYFCHLGFLYAIALVSCTRGVS